MIEGEIFEDAVTLCNIALQNDSSNPEALYMHAYCCVSLGDFEAAKESLVELSTIDLREDEELSLGLAELLQEYQSITKKNIKQKFKLHPNSIQKK